MPQSLRPTLTRYGGALLGVVLATLVRLVMDPVLRDNQPFVFYYMAAALAALLGGLGPGLLTVALGALLAPYFFVQPRYTVLNLGDRAVLGVLFYLLTGGIITFLSEGLRSARRRALEGQDALREEMARRRLVESSLLDREARFRALIEHSSDVISMLDASGRIAFISPSIRRVTGFAPEELIGTPGLDLIHPEDRDEASAALERAAARPGEPVVSSRRIRHRDGSWQSVENVSTDFRGDPSIAAVVGSSRDVTERRAMEDQVRLAEARFRAFMDNSPAITFIKDDQGRYVWGNPAWARQFGRPAEELFGRDDFALWPEEVARIMRGSDRSALESDATVEVLETIGDRHFMCFKFPLEHEGGRFVGGKVLDVTDRVEAEAAVRRNERLLHALADSMPQIVWAARPDGHLDYFNRRWFEYTGLTAEQTFGPNGWAPILHPDDLERTIATWDEAVRTGEPYQIDYRFRDHRTGDYRWHLGRALPVRDDSGAIVRWYGTCTDIHDQKKAVEAAEAADQAKTRFLAVLSHELRTPLTPVLLSVSAMLDDPSLGGELRSTLEMARRNIALESRLIDDLLDVTRIASGKFSMHPEPADAHALIARVVEICRPDIDNAGLTLSLDLAAAGATISADPARLQQVFWNLIKNAVKFTPAGGAIAIRTRIEGDTPARRLVAEVQDSGIGIDPEFLPRIFEAFEQAETSPWTRRYGGLGLGLAIGRAVVERHGGLLTARSQGPDQGATFRVELPATAAEEASPTPARAGGPAGGERDGGGAEGLRILLIEDDPSTLLVLSRLLKRNHHAVTTADSVTAALAAADREADGFDLIISDIGLPDGNGVDLMRTLQSRRAWPAIALTGYGQDEDIRRSHSAGFRAHLTKPIDFGVLEAKIKEVVASAS